jgi:hypothetical protein
MIPSNVRQMAYVCDPEAWESTVDYWQRVAGVGPFWTAIVEPENQMYLGRPTNGRLETAMGYLGNVQIEVIRPLNHALSPWTDWRTPGLQIPPAGYFHHFMIETDDFDATLQSLLGGGSAVGLTADPPGGGRFVYVDARATFGCWIELAQRLPWRDLIEQMMKDATRGWDGRSPRRSYFDLLAEAQGACARQPSSSGQVTSVAPIACAPSCNSRSS